MSNYKFSPRWNPIFIMFDNSYLWLIVIFLMLVNLSTVRSALRSTSYNNGAQQPCDRTRRVSRDTYGEISDGPTGSNYTQVKIIINIHCPFNNTYS